MRIQRTPKRCPYCERVVLHLREHQDRSRRCRALRERIKRDGQARIDELKAQGWEEHTFNRVMGFSFDLPESVGVKIKEPNTTLIPGWVRHVGEQLEEVLNAEATRLRRIFLDCVRTGKPTPEAETLILLHKLGEEGSS